VLAQAIPLVLAGSIYPAGLILMAIYLASSRPKGLGVCLFLGALTTTVVSGLVLLVLMRSLNLDSQSQSNTRGGVRVAIGVLFVVLGVRLLVRKRAAADPVSAAEPVPAKKPGLVARLQSQSRLRAAFLAGLIVYFPGPGYIAAIEVIGTTSASLAATAGTFVVVVLLDLWLIWVPLLTYLVAPEATSRRLHAFSGWLDRNGRTLLAGVLIGIGCALAATGLTTLAS
jgi:threonine/homoserine/homoserine lactone efflux protein